MADIITKLLDQAKATPKGIKLTVHLYAYDEGDEGGHLLFSTPGGMKRCTSREQAEKFATELVDALMTEAA